MISVRSDIKRAIGLLFVICNSSCISGSMLIVGWFLVSYDCGGAIEIKGGREEERVITHTGKKGGVKKKGKGRDE